MVLLYLHYPERNTMNEKKNHEYEEERNAWISYLNGLKTISYQIFHVTVNFFNTKEFTNQYRCYKSLRYWYLRCFLPHLLNTTNTTTNNCKKRQPIVLGWLERHQSNNRHHIIRDSKDFNSFEHLPTKHYHLVVATKDDQSLSRLRTSLNKKHQIKDLSSNGIEDYWITENNEYLPLYPNWEDYKRFDDVTVKFGYANEKSLDTVGNGFLK